MLKKSITYTDFNGDQITEDFFFHLSKAELIELEMSHKDGLSEAMKKIIEAEDGKAIMEEFKKIILKAYGKKSEDGKRFIKTQELREEFESSEAFSELFMELVTNADAASEFVNGMVPAGFAEEIEAFQAKTTEKPQTIQKRILTKAEAQAMDIEEFYAGLRDGTLDIEEEKLN